LGELATLAQEKAQLVLVVMNDEGYGVIRNMQDARFEGRRYFADLATPGFAVLAANLGIRSWKVGSIQEFKSAIDEAVTIEGPTLIEVNMTAIGPYAVPFAGPPVPSRKD
jgi:acetolactate synthase-1/2/3 large subunit